MSRPMTPIDIAEITPSNLTLGHRVRRMRLAREHTLLELAELTSVSPQTISNIERGKGTTSRMLIRLADSLGTSLDWLVGFSGPILDDVNADNRLREFIDDAHTLLPSQRSALATLMRNLPTNAHKEAQDAEKQEQESAD